MDSFFYYFEEKERERERSSEDMNGHNEFEWDSLWADATHESEYIVINITQSQRKFSPPRSHKDIRCYILMMLDYGGVNQKGSEIQVRSQGKSVSMFNGTHSSNEIFIFLRLRTTSKGKKQHIIRSQNSAHFTTRSALRHILILDYVGPDETQNIYGHVEMQ